MNTRPPIITQVGDANFKVKGKVPTVLLQSLKIKRALSELQVS